ncbi:MAG: FeS-binding protein [Desulfatiglandales bacterium]
MRKETEFAGIPILKGAYVFVLVVMAITGFGQMPIFKRYYIADIPGLGWSADYYFTHTLHYLGAIALMGLLAYFMTDYVLRNKNTYRLTAAAYVRIFFMAGLVGTGILRVLKNLPDITFSPELTLIIDLGHLGFMISFVIVALAFLIFKRGWLRGTY